MKNARKLLSLVLSVALLLGMVAVPVSAEFIDVKETTKHSEAIEVLVALKMLKGYEDGSFRPENTITRAEFATVIARMLGLESVAVSASAKDVFTDMTVGGGEHWASGYIKIAYDLGIILGMGDGTFAPDNPVTYEQAVKMMVCALGYEAAALEVGGWPDGYLTQAAELELVKDISVEKSSAPATRAIVAQVLYNSLEVKLAEKSGDGSIRRTEKNILKDKLGYAPFKNYMVTQVDGTESIADTGLRVREGELVFAQENEVFAYNDVFTKAEAREMLGKYVSGFYKMGSEEETNVLLYVQAASTKSTEIKLLSEDIVDFHSLKVEYYMGDSAEVEELEISSDAQLMYNGTLYDYKASEDAKVKNLSAWLDPSSTDFINGEVRFVENTGDSRIDTIFIEDYEIYIAKAAVITTDTLNSNNYVINDKYDSGKSVRIDPYASNVTAEFYNAQTGAVMQIEDIKAMNVVSVAANKANTKFKVYISTKTVKGKIQQLDSGDGYVIDGKTYPTTDVFEAQITKGTVLPTIGAEGTFYLDHNDRICAANITIEDAGDYAYITRAAEEGDRAILMLMNLNGSPSKPTKMKCAQTVKVNGKKYTGENARDAVLRALAETAPLIAANKHKDATGTDYAQLIRYKKQGNEIISIRTIATVSGSPDDTIKVAKNENEEYLVTGQEMEKITYNLANGFGGKVFVSASTLVLEIPNNRLAESEYKRSSATKYLKGGESYYIEAYNMNKSNVAKVVLVYNADAASASSSVGTSTPISIVKEVAGPTISSLVEGDLEVYKVTVYQNGKLETYETEGTEAPFDTIKEGDILRFGFNNDGQINLFGRANRDDDNKHELNTAKLEPQKITDVHLDGGYELTTNGLADFMTIFGTVSALSDTHISVTPAFVNDDGTLETKDQETFIVNSSLYKYRIILRDKESIVEPMTDLSTIKEFGEGQEKKASLVFIQSGGGVLRNLVLVVDERTQP